MEQPLGRQAEQCLAAGQDPNTQRLCLWTQSYRGFNPHQGGGGAGGLGGRGGGGFGLVAMWLPPVASTLSHRTYYGCIPLDTTVMTGCPWRLLVASVVGTGATPRATDAAPLSRPGRLA